jgi:hypothetical protein
VDAQTFEAIFAECTTYNCPSSLFCRCGIVISSASPASPDASPAAEAGPDYYATEAHYLSFARRIAAALRAGGTFFLVTGDPPPGPHQISQALRKATESRHAVIDVDCRPDLTLDEMSRAGIVVTRLPTGGGATAVSETSEPAPPLFVFDDVDKLSEQQIREIFELTQHAGPKGAAAVLLARLGFLARLEEPSLRFLKEGLAARLGFQEVGQDEGIDFLRHQLAARHHRNEPRGIPPGVFRGLAALVLLLTVGVGAVLFLHYVDREGEPPARSVTGTSATREASAPQSTPSEMPAKATPPTERAAIVSGVPPIAAMPQPRPIPPSAPPGPNSAAAKAPATLRETSPAAAPGLTQPARAPETTPPAAALAPARDPAKQKPASPVAIPAPAEASRVPERAPPLAFPAPEQEPTPPQATSPPASPPPTQSPADQRLSPTEIAALVTRGDRFLSAGDIASARLFYERAAGAGDGSAALRLGATFDPGFLGRAGVRGTIGDSAQASSWYRRARDLGNAAAGDRLKTLEQERLAEPNPPAH